MTTTKKTAHVLLAAGALVLVACGSPRSGASVAPDAAGRPTTTTAPLSFATAPPASVAGNVVSFELAARGCHARRGAAPLHLGGGRAQLRGHARRLGRRVRLLLPARLQTAA